MDLEKIVNEDSSQFISNQLMTHDELPDLLTWLDYFDEIPRVHINIYFLLRNNALESYIVGDEFDDKHVG